jgi:hypothetical protein
MGTRAVFDFRDNMNEKGFCVYKHWDGYPEGAARFLTDALVKAWDLPRYENGEFAASFIAANKENAGDIHITNAPEDHGDIEYVYEIFQAKNGQMIVRAYSVDFWREDDRKKEEIFYGRLKDFVANYGNDDVKKMWDELDRSPHKLLDRTSDPEYVEYVRLKNKFETV